MEAFSQQLYPIRYNCYHQKSLNTWCRHVHCQKVPATENAEVAHVFLNSNCLTLGPKPWGGNVNLIVFVHPLVFFCSLLKPSGLEYY